MSTARSAPPTAAGAERRGTHLVVDTLRREGIRAAFGYPGGAIMPLYDAFAELAFPHVLVRHEQAAAHAAAGYAQVAGTPGVCVATSGPGATNLVTGLADALLDSIPVVAITGQVPTSLIGTDAFQEVDVFGLTLPVVKHSFLVERPDRLGEQLDRAFRIAAKGRPGPVLVDLPKDVQTAACPPRATRPSAVLAWDGHGLGAAIDLLRASERPLIYAGGGIQQGRARGAFRAFAELLGAPVVCTLKGLGALPSGHPQRLGMMGMHGVPRANRALAHADLLIVLGARFDDRATGKLAEFCPRAKVLHFEIDPAEIGKLRRADVALCGPLAETLPAVVAELAASARAARRWHPGAAPSAEMEAPWTGDGLCPRDVLQALDADVVTTDVGQHQMWAAQYLRFHDGMQFLTSGGLGTMGFGLPAAIGAQIARPGARVACVTGDGSLMMMIHELATLRRYDLPITIVLFDNACLGMVRQQQEILFGNRESEIDLSDNPDFAAVARAFGIPARTLEHGADLAPALSAARAADGPFLLHCKIDRQANVWPFVPSGRGNHEMLMPAPVGQTTPGEPIADEPATRVASGAGR